MPGGGHRSEGDRSCGGHAPLPLRDALCQRYWNVAPHLNRKNYRSCQEQRADRYMRYCGRDHREFGLDCTLSPGYAREESCEAQTELRDQK